MGNYIATINVENNDAKKATKKKKKKSMPGCIMNKTSRVSCYFCPVKGCLYSKVFKLN